MAGTPPSTKRMKTKVVRSGGKIEGWFSGELEQINKFLLETSWKTINTPKLVSFIWMKQQNLSTVRSLLKEQRLKKFLELTRNIYPDLVKVFHTNLQFSGDSLVSHVKGVDMVITNDVWTAVAGLKFSGIRINRGHLGVIEDFNKIQFYKSCLKDSNSKVRNFLVGGLKLDERLIAFIVPWIITPRGSNHSTLSKEDLLMIYCIMNKVKINWIHTIKEHMQKATRLSNFHYPYAILISKLLHYFEVDVEGELAEIIKPSSEINNGPLRKMGFTKIGGRWVSKDGDHAGPSGINDEDEVVEPVATDYVGPSTDVGGERITSMTSFERLMLNRMGSLAEQQNNLYEMCQNRFQQFDQNFQGLDARFGNLDEQIEVIQNHISDL